MMGVVLSALSENSSPSTSLCWSAGPQVRDPATWYPQPYILVLKCWSSGERPSNLVSPALHPCVEVLVLRWGTQQLGIPSPTSLCWSAGPQVRDPATWYPQPYIPVLKCWSSGERPSNLVSPALHPSIEVLVLRWETQQPGIPSPTSLCWSAGPQVRDPATWYPQPYSPVLKCWSSGERPSNLVSSALHPCVEVLVLRWYTQQPGIPSLTSLCWSAGPQVSDPATWYPQPYTPVLKCWSSGDTPFNLVAPTTW